MSSADAAARIIERLLADPPFRAVFRSDPAGACREAGLHDLAEEFALPGAGQALMTLDLRESRSSLAGVMMAAALEGVAAFAFIEHVAPVLADAPDAVKDVLSRVDLPALGGLQGALAPGAAQAAVPPPAASGAAEAGAAPAGASAGAPAGAAAAPAGVAAASAPAAAPAESGQFPAIEAKEPAKPPKPDPPKAEPAKPDPPKPDPPKPDPPEPEPPEPDPPPREPAPAEPEARAASLEPEIEASGEPVDPAQLGMDGTGGTPTPETLALLENDNVTLDSDTTADLKEGRIDPRVVAVLTKLSEDHELQISCMCRDHPSASAGGGSNHYYGRGVDIAGVDGMPVNSANPAAREIATELNSLNPDYLPTEVGTPWALGPSPPYFTDADHADHVHVGFDAEIPADWKPPADVAASGAADIDDGAPRNTLAVQAAGSARKARATLGAVAAVAGAGAGGERAGAGADPAAGGDAATDGGGAAAQGLDVDIDPDGPQPGAKALAAVKEALKFKGTAYVWGGSTPETGFDCSGLMQWAYAQQGIETTRTTYTQIANPAGEEVGRDELLPGDLIFFQSASGDVHHVGMSLGGDRFLHAPSTGDVVKESSLNESYYASEFAGGRRFVEAGSGELPDADAVQGAQAVLARDVADSKRPGTLVFEAIKKQERSYANSTVQFMRAIRPEDVAGKPDALTGPTDYPGDDAPKEEIAAWMGRKAEEAGLPPELPVMAALVESNLSNLDYGDAASVGYFQMQTTIWNQGEYLGYPDDAELQIKWFVDHAKAVKEQRVAAGDTAFLDDDSQWGLWVADTERPAEEYRYRYQERLEEARALLGLTGR